MSRLLFAELPSEGLPGIQERQLKKHCYGLLDGPYQWYIHLGYEQSQPDPCLFMLFKDSHQQGQGEEQARQIEGIIGVAADDLLHGGGKRHWDNVTWIQHYKLGKFRQGRWPICWERNSMLERWTDQDSPEHVRKREDQNRHHQQREKERKI